MSDLYSSNYLYIYIVILLNIITHIGFICVFDDNFVCSFKINI